MVAMTAPQIGNTGINEEDIGRTPHLEAFLLRGHRRWLQLARPSGLGQFLREHGVMAWPMSIPAP